MGPDRTVPLWRGPDRSGSDLDFLVGWKCITSDEHNTPPRANAPPDLVVVCPSFLVASMVIRVVVW